MKGLLDGGLKYANGKSVSSEDLKELVRLIKDAKNDESTSGLSILLTRQQKIDDWLASHGF
ncbi:MAG: hypothetical protein LUC44_08555 [Prevotellaceae bacterium]|nr:hypothetical protein [Prevotellaceae bacterium]